MNVTMYKKVNVNTTKVINLPARGNIIGKLKNTYLSCSDILTCLKGGADVDEVFSNGKTLRLSSKNYNKKNHAPADKTSNTKMVTNRVQPTVPMNNNVKTFTAPKDIKKK